MVQSSCIRADRLSRRHLAGKVENNQESFLLLPGKRFNVSYHPLKPKILMSNSDKDIQDNEKEPSFGDLLLQGAHEALAHARGDLKKLRTTRMIKDKYGVRLGSLTLPVDDELKDLCGEILIKAVTREDWLKIEFEDVIQTKHYWAGFDAARPGFHFQYHGEAEGFEFELSLSDIEDIAFERKVSVEMFPSRPLNRTSP